jgi:hypothetical protein
LSRRKNGATNTSIIVPALLTPPRRADARLQDGEAFDPEALIKEARRRARRRRAAYTTLALVGIAAGFAGFSALGGGSSAPRSRESVGPSGRVGPAATVKDTLHLPTGGATLFAARAGSLYAVLVSPDERRSISVLRVGRGGARATSRVAFDEPEYLMDISVGPDGLYAGTAVIKRFTSQPDQLLRLDPRTLAIRARATFPASVVTTAHGTAMWASIGDGRVARLDPRTLAVLASRQVVRDDTSGEGASILSKPAVGLGSLWVLSGDARDRELVRMDPKTLAIRSRTAVPTGDGLSQAFDRAVADAGHVYLVGRAVVAVDRLGRLATRPVVVPGLQTAAIYRNALVGLTNGHSGVVLLDAHGRVLARTRVADAGGHIAVSDRDAWFLGNAGRREGLVHVQLANR